MTESLTDCKLFLNMTESEKLIILEKMHYQTKKFQKGDVIVYAQDKVIQLLILIKGKVRTEMSETRSKTVKIADISAPAILAPGFIFGKSSFYPVSLYAEMDCVIMAVTKEIFEDVMLSNKKLTLNFLNIISNQTQFLSRKIKFLQLKNIKSKIAHFLISTSRRQDSLKIKTGQSQTQMAELFGVTRPSLSRTLNEIQSDGIIKINGKEIEILHPEILKKWLMEM